MPKHQLPLLLLFLVILSACGPASTPESTATLTATNTPRPTVTPTATLEPVVLADFSAQLEGVGSHGGMACYTYTGDPADLEKVVLTADFLLGSTPMEQDIPLEVVDEKNCFELVDAKYVTVDPEDGTLKTLPGAITLKIHASFPGFVPVEDDFTESEDELQPVINNDQRLDLGKYVQFPFMGWIYNTTQVCKVNAHIYDGNRYMAWDFVPYPTAEFPTIINTSLLSPVDGYIYSSGGADTQYGSNTGLLIFSPATGFFISLVHNAPLFITPENYFISTFDWKGNPVLGGNTIAMIGPKDADSGMPHTHMQVLIPPEEVDLENPDEAINTFLSRFYGTSIPYIDFVGSQLFLDPAINNYLLNLPNSAEACGHFPWGTLTVPPSQLPLTIDGDASDWAGTTPVLTDPAGDSSSGEVMDFTELYTAMDDNYLYLLLKAGTQPAGEWAVNFYIDTREGGTCGDADTILSISSANPDSFTTVTPRSCAPGDDADDGMAGPGSFKWLGSVLEIKIPLIFLDDFTKLEPTWLISYIMNDDGSYTMPDSMP